MADGQRKDGEMLKNIKGSPTNWKVDAGEDSQLVEVEDRNDPALNPDLGVQVGRRTGEKRSLYLSRRDFERHGHTDGCRGCRTLRVVSRGLAVSCHRTMRRVDDAWRLPSRQHTPIDGRDGC